MNEMDGIRVEEFRQLKREIRVCDINMGRVDGGVFLRYYLNAY
jgi:hypothetical protein